MKTLQYSPWIEQKAAWPNSGRHILAQYDDQSVVVYQAYSPAIADWAVEQQRFGGPWSFERMSWIKPNILWMMYRCGWATKERQERVLAVRMSREGFDTVLARSVESSHHPEVTGLAYEDWRRAGKRAGVRLQWDPDHGPGGEPLERRAVQLGLRNETLRSFATEWVESITDITSEVVERRGLERSALTTPTERVYLPAEPELRAQLRLTA